MALKKMYRVLDIDRQPWFVAATSFRDAIDQMRSWEADADEMECVTSVELMDGELIDGGTREEDI